MVIFLVLVLLWSFPTGKNRYKWQLCQCVSLYSETLPYYSSLIKFFLFWTNIPSPCSINDMHFIVHLRRQISSLRLSYLWYYLSVNKGNFLILCNALLHENVFTYTNKSWLIMLMRICHKKTTEKSLLYMYYAPLLNWNCVFLTDKNHAKIYLIKSIIIFCLACNESCCKGGS